MPIPVDYNRVSAGDRLLGVLSRMHGRFGPIDLEFSIRLSDKRVEDRGRSGFWLTEAVGWRIGDVVAALAELEAPDEIRAALRATAPVRVGVSVAQDGKKFRCYIHDRMPATSKDRYRAWRWSLDGALEHRVYEFHFMPETPDGCRPLDLIDPVLRPGFARLLADERLRLVSGFWLRYRTDGEVDQVDIAMPWHPPLGSVAGRSELGSALHLPVAALERWYGLPVRHIATSGQSVTVYASAPLRQSQPPATEAELQDQVLASARQLSGEIENRFFLKPMPCARQERNIDLNSFYGGDVALWRRVLGPALHYHAGLFDRPDSEPDDAAMDDAVRRAVIELYPYLRAAERVYDIGCGWGGPLAMLARERGCHALGLTVSRTQFRHVAALGLPVRWGDAEATLPPGWFDVALLLESLSHIRDKSALLRRLRDFAGRLVMRVNCQDAAPAASVFGGSMHVVPSAKLRALITDAGWTIRHWRDRRVEAVPSVAVWHRRLSAIAPTGDTHLEILRDWCARVAEAPRAWAANNPLIEVVAD